MSCKHYAPSTCVYCDRDALESKLQIVSAERDRLQIEVEDMSARLALAAAHLARHTASEDRAA